MTMKTSCIVAFLFVVLVGGTWLLLRPADESSLAPVATESLAAQGIVPSAADGTYRLVPGASQMRWQGRRPLIQGYFDNGTIAIASGQAVVADDALLSGSVVVDMTTINASTTGRGDGEDRLTQHLKSADWFDVEQYPESRFVINEAPIQDDGTVLLIGMLTIQDRTHPLRFPVTVAQQADTLVIVATDIPIDRTQWDIRYGSGSFFDNLGEQLIDDIFTLSFTAVFELDSAAAAASLKLQ
jgi:polyisoprenoid-binding protein YceI